MLACNSQWKHLGRGKDPICPFTPPPPRSGRTYSPPQPANTHALAWLSPRLCNIHADTYLDIKRACRANLRPRTAGKTKRALLSTSKATCTEAADKTKRQQQKDGRVPASCRFTLNLSEEPEPAVPPHSVAVFSHFSFHKVSDCPV